MKMKKFWLSPHLKSLSPHMHMWRMATRLDNAALDSKAGMSNLNYTLGAAKATKTAEGAKQSA